MSIGKHSVAAQDVRLWEPLLFGGVLSGVLVALALLDEGTGRRVAYVAAALAWVLSFVMVAPRKVWLENGTLYAKRRGRTESIALREIAEIDLPVGIKGGELLLFRRADGTGFDLMRLDAGTIAFRAELGRQIAQLTPGPRIGKSARPFLGLDAGG